MHSRVSTFTAHTALHCCLLFLCHKPLKEISRLGASFSSVWSQFFPILMRAVWDSQILLVNCLFIYFYFLATDEVTAELCQNCHLQWLLLTILGCFLVQIYRDAWEQSLVMQLLFLGDFVPTLNLFTSSVVVSGKLCFCFNLKGTSEKLIQLLP